MRKTSPILIILVIVIGIIVIAALVINIPTGKNFSLVPTSNSSSGTSQSSTSIPTTSNSPSVPSSLIPISPPDASSRSITLDGTLVCLPPLHTNGPQTMEYAIGLLSTKGEYYVLVDTNPTYSNISKFPTNTAVEVIGSITSQISMKYKSSGTISVSSINQVGDNGKIDSPTTTGIFTVGQTEDVNGVSITLNAITQDSRCTIGVQCVYAGAVVANVTLRKSVISQNITLSSDAAPYSFTGYDVSIVGISPAKTSSQIPEAAYQLTFKVQEE